MAADRGTEDRGASGAPDAPSMFPRAGGGWFNEDCIGEHPPPPSPALSARPEVPSCLELRAFPPTGALRPPRAAQQVPRSGGHRRGGRPRDVEGRNKGRQPGGKRRKKRVGSAGGGGAWAADAGAMSSMHVEARGAALTPHPLLALSLQEWRKCTVVSVTCALHAKQRAPPRCPVGGTRPCGALPRVPPGP